MLTRPSSLVSGLLFLVLSSALPATAQLVPLGPQVRVDSGALHVCPSVAMDPDGGFTVAWSRAQSDGSFTCIPEGRLQGRSFGREGQPRGPVFPIAGTGSVCSFDVRLGPASEDGPAAAPASRPMAKASGWWRGGDAARAATGSTSSGSAARGDG